MDLSTNFISVNVYNQSSITSCPPKDISLNLNRNPIFQNHLDKCLDQISVDPNPDFEIFPMFPKFSHPLFSLYPQIYFSTINVTDRMVFDVYFASPLFEDFYLWTRFPSNDPKFSFNYISSHEIANISISIRNYDIKGLEKRIDTLFDLFKLTSPNYIIFEVESSGKKYRFSQEILISNSTECSKGFVFDEAPKASNPRCSCPPGSHALAENALDQCVTCRPGRYTASMGLMECLSCPFNSYSDFNGASHCLKCPENSLTLEIDAKNISYCSCSQGYYGVASEGCKSCANFVGSDCPGATLLPKAQSGFWLDMDVQDDLGRPLFFECIPAFACMGTPNADGINKCSEGYTNRLCGDCLYGRYFRRNGHCVNCGKHSRFVFALCFILALFFTYWLLLRAVPSSNKLHSLIIIITWFQTISLFSYLRIKWPPMVLSVFSALSFFNFNIELFSPECSVGFSYWTKWYLRLLSPLFFISFVCLFAFIQLVLGKKSFILRNLFCFQRLHPKMTFADFKSSLHHPDLYARTRYVYVLFSLGLTMYTSLAATSSEPFNCIPNERTSVLIMHRNPSEFCDSSAWRSNIAVAYIACVIYLVFVPGLVFFIIRKNRGKLFQKRTINIYGALFIPYRMEAYYWEVIRLIRKATVICLIDFLSRFDLVYMQVILILWVISINLILQVLIKPFALESNNKLAFIWNATAIVFVFAGSIFNSASEIKPIESSTLTVLLYAFLFVSIFWSIRALFREQKANLVIQTLEHQHSPRVSHYELRNIQKEFIKTLFPKTHAKVWKKFGYSNIKDRIKFFEDCESLNPSIIQMENKIKPGKMALPIPSDFSLGTLTTHPVLSSARTFQDEDTDTGVGYQHNTGFGISHMASSDPIRVNFNATQSHRIASELDDEE